MAKRALLLAGVLMAGASCAHGGEDGPSSAAVLPRAVEGSPDQPPTQPVIPGSVVLGERRRCMDLELQRRGLNQYGDPFGTTYPTGSPLVNAVSGTTEDRYDYVTRRLPDIGTRCSRAAYEPGW